MAIFFYPLLEPTVTNKYFIFLRQDKVRVIVGKRENVHNRHIVNTANLQSSTFAIVIITFAIWLFVTNISVGENFLDTATLSNMGEMRN